MLVIRMQRTGRKGLAQFRVVVQDSRRTPTSGKIVANLGHFNPHTKETALNKEKTAFYLEHGAQPSERAARLLKSEGVKLPKWVKLEGKKKREIRNPEKLRRNRPDEPVETAAKPEASAEAAEATESPADETAAEAHEQAPVAEELAENEVPAEETAAEDSSNEAANESAEDAAGETNA